MDKVIPAIIVAVILVVALGLMVLGWRARQRRQITLPEPHRVPATLGTVLGEFRYLPHGLPVPFPHAGADAAHHLG